VRRRLAERAATLAASGKAGQAFDEADDDD
jgi:hypothetical protein